MSTDYSVILTADGTQYTFYPQSCVFTRPLCSRSLRHEEQSAAVVLPYSPTLLALFVENEQLPAVIKDGTVTIFTGVITVDLNWDDAGELDEIESFSTKIKDNTFMLDASSAVETALTNTTVGAVITSICTARGISIASNAVLPSTALEIFQADSGSNYKTLLDDLCYQNGKVFLFDDNGSLILFDLSAIPDNPAVLDESALSIKVGVQKSKRDYTGVKIGYNTITKKDNELIYFSGNGYKSDSTVQPYVIQPNVYFPFDSDPALETTNGQIYQSYESGYAQTLVKLNGEQKYQRSSGTTLLHTENQYLVNDWDGGTLSVNRTEFGSKQSSVRLLNTGSTDVNLYSLSIRATAWYRETDASVSAGGTDNPYEYDAKYIYTATSAETLAKLLTRYLCIGQYQLQTQTEDKIPLGTFRTIATGATGYTVKALAISYNHDPDKEYYTTTWISISDAKVNVTKVVYQGSSTGDAAAQTTPSKTLNKGSLTVSAAASMDGITIKTAVSDNLQTAVRSIQLQLRKSSTAVWSSSIDSALGSYIYTFIRSTDGYPEAAAAAAYQVRARYTNIYGATSDWTNPVSVTADNYGTWLLQTPAITASINGRSVILSVSQPNRSDNKAVYGTVSNKIYIRKPGTDAAEAWYKPATSSDPRESVNNYKDGTGYVTAAQQYSQTLPLDGQNATEPLPVDTAYQYKIVAYNEAGESAAATVTITALATGARDLAAATITENKIATGAVTQNAIADSAISTAKIVNDAITNAKIADNAVQTENIVSNAVTEAKVAASAITNTKIADDSISTPKLQAGSVIAGKIAAGAVETDKLAANAVTAGKIAAYTITADRIQTGSDTNHVLYGLDTFDNWNVVPCYGANTSHAAFSLNTDLQYCYTGKKSLSITGDSSNTDGYIYLGSSSYNYGCIPVTAGKIYILSCYVKTTATSAGVDLFTVSHTAINYTNSAHAAVSAIVKNSDGWVRLQNKFTANSSYPYISIRVDNNTAGATVYFDAFQLEEADSPLQTASAFTPAPVTVIDGNNVIANTITADKVAANAVTAEKVAAGAVTTDKLAANAVTADKIHANTITGDKIAATNLAANGAVLGSISGNKVGTTSSNFWSGLDTNTPEFRIGNDPALEDNGSDAAVFFHFKWIAGVATLTMKLVNFILTSVASIIKGVFRVKAAAATDANSFMTVNPESSADSTTGTPAQTVNIKGDVRALSYYTNGKLLPRYFTLDLSTLSTSNFYPVTFGAGDSLLECEIHSPSTGAAAAYNQNIIHFQLIANGWSDTPKRFDVMQYGVYDSNEITIGCIGYGNTNGERCVWMRGGMVYRFYCTAFPTLRTANYSYGSSSTEIYTVGSNYYGGTNTNVTIIWTPDTSLQSYHSGSHKITNNLTVGGIMQAAIANTTGDMSVGGALNVAGAQTNTGMITANGGIRGKAAYFDYINTTNNILYPKVICSGIFYYNGAIVLYRQAGFTAITRNSTGIYDITLENSITFSLLDTANVVTIGWHYIDSGGDINLKNVSLFVIGNVGDSANNSLNQVLISVPCYYISASSGGVCTVSKIRIVICDNNSDSTEDPLNYCKFTILQSFIG